MSASVSAESAGTVADLARMRAQWRAGWVAADYEPTDPALASALARIGTDARRWWSTMATGANRRALWEDARLDVHRSFAISRSFDRLFRMALGWATRGSDTHQDPKLLADLIDALDWMVAHYYRADGEILGNWFEWMISGPRALNLAAMLVYDRLTPARLSAYTSAVAASSRATTNRTTMPGTPRSTPPWGCSWPRRRRCGPGSPRWSGSGSKPTLSTTGCGDAASRRCSLPAPCSPTTR